MFYGLVVVVDSCFYVGQLLEDCLHQLVDCFKCFGDVCCCTERTGGLAGLIGVVGVGGITDNGSSRVGVSTGSTIFADRLFSFSDEGVGCLLCEVDCSVEFNFNFKIVRDVDGVSALTIVDCEKVCWSHFVVVSKVLSWVYAFHCPWEFVLAVGDISSIFVFVVKVW